MRAKPEGNVMIQLRRVYDAPQEGEGLRFLVDRLWPRGCRRETLQLHGWLKELAPGNELRHWFDHDPAKWEEFQKRYFAELEADSTAWQPLLTAAREGTITLLYAARDEQHNNAVALRKFLLQKIDSC